jgi:hypothetical protein
MREKDKHCLLWCCHLWGLLSVECWLLTIDCWLSTVDCRMHVVGYELCFGQRMRENILYYGAVACEDCWLLTVESMLWDMQFVWEKDEGKGKPLSVTVLSLVRTVECWVLTIDYWLLTIHYWLFTVDSWLLIVDCRLSTVECMLWDMNFVLGKDEGKGETLSVMVLSLVRTVDCWLLIIDYWLFTIDCSLLTVDCWLSIFDCRMHVVGHELHFGENRREKHCLLWCCRLWGLSTVDFGTRSR